MNIVRLQWSEDEQTCISESMVKARRAESTPSIRTVAENLVVQVNDGKHITFKVGDNAFNADELPTSLRGYSDGFARCAAAEESSQAAVNAQVNTKLGELSAQIQALKGTIASNTAATEANAKAAEAIHPKVADLGTKAGEKTEDTVTAVSERADAIEKAAKALTTKVGELDLQLNPPCEG
eukprot:gene16602-13338_t